MCICIIIKNEISVLYYFQKAESNFHIYFCDSAIISGHSVDNLSLMSLLGIVAINHN